jgi:hypothetical protein
MNSSPANVMAGFRFFFHNYSRNHPSRKKRRTPVPLRRNILLCNCVAKLEAYPYQPSDYSVSPTPTTLTGIFCILLQLDLSVCDFTISCSSSRHSCWIQLVPYRLSCTTSSHMTPDLRLCTHSTLERFNVCRYIIANISRNSFPPIPITQQSVRMGRSC